MLNFLKSILSTVLGMVIGFFLIVLIGVFQKRPLLEMVTIAISLAVAAIPEAGYILADVQILDITFRLRIC